MCTYDWIYRWMNEVNQLVNQSSVSPRMNQSVSSSPCQSVSQSVSQSVNQSVYYTHDWIHTIKTRFTENAWEWACIMYGYDILDDIKKKKEKSKLVSSAKYTPFEWRTPKPALHCFCVGLWFSRQWAPVKGKIRVLSIWGSFIRVFIQIWNVLRWIAWHFPVEWELSGRPLSAVPCAVIVRETVLSASKSMHSRLQRPLKKRKVLEMSDVCHAYICVTFRYILRVIWNPQWGTDDAEMKVLSIENPDQWLTAGAVGKNLFRAVGTLVSNWILTSCQPHRVTSGQSNSVMYKRTLQSLSYSLSLSLCLSLSLSLSLYTNPFSSQSTKPIPTQT